MNLLQRVRLSRVLLVASGLAVAGCGGGSDQETTAVVAKSQQSASQQWADAKANGTDKNTSKSVRPQSSGSQGHTLGPGGAN